jgi:hypothetical protein
MPGITCTDYLDGALVATFPEGITREQAYEVRRGVLQTVPKAVVKFTGVQMAGEGVAPLRMVEVGPQRDGEFGPVRFG